MPRVAINGLGRIGRAALKIVLDGEGLDLVAVNDIADVDNLAYLLKYDTVYGRYHRKVSAAEGALVVDGRRIPVLAEPDPASLPWDDLGIDLVLECTGVFTTADDLERHIQAGASYVILSAPTKSETVPTVVHGVNRARRPTAGHLVRQLHHELHHPGDRGRPPPARSRARDHDHRPRLHGGPATGRRAEQELPPWQGRRGQPCAHLDRGRAGHDPRRARARRALRWHRRPRADPCGLDRGHRVRRQPATTTEEVNDAFRQEAATARYAGILNVSEEPLVSADIVGDPHAAIVDLELTKVVDGTLVKVMAWYDNEWGFTHQMIREARSTLESPTPRDARAAMRAQLRAASLVPRANAWACASPGSRALACASPGYARVIYARARARRAREKQRSARR